MREQGAAMYCDEDDLKDYVLEAYLTKAEELNSGGAARHIAIVEEEVESALLAGGYHLPLERVPAKLKAIAAIIAAYRTMSNITSVMTQDSGSGNDWVGLQTLYKRAMKDLDDIRTGALQLFPVDDPEPVSGMSVASKPRHFDEHTWWQF